jgi:hypothetical protein
MCHYATAKRLHTFIFLTFYAVLRILLAVFGTFSCMPTMLLKTIAAITGCDYCLEVSRIAPEKNQ